VTYALDLDIAGERHELVVRISTRETTYFPTRRRL